ncbi:MAG: hypothetical protein ACI4PF_01100 [Christensenellales bacterium]
MDLYKYCEKRAMSGYKSALLYKEYNETLYHLLLPLETAPAVNGSVDTFDFDILTCPSKGKVEGKETLDEKDVDFLWHRDNVHQLERLQGRVLDFMVVYQDFTARTFTGTIKVRPQDASADIMRGTFTITPMSASSNTLLDARDLIQDTISFVNQIPTSVMVGATAEKVEIVTNPKDNVTITTSVDNSNFVIGDYTDGKISITSTDNTKTHYGVVMITASADGYASWTTSIALENIVTAGA